MVVASWVTTQQAMIGGENGLFSQILGPLLSEAGNAH